MSTTWTPEIKQQVIDKYIEAEPTAENTIEIIQGIADELKQSVNGIRMILIQAGVYVKKEAGTTSSGGASKKTTEGKESTGTKRVSKESQIDALKKAIEEAGQEVDDDILSKLTGKAATYFTSIITKK